jgi:hypothetical protein
MRHHFRRKASHLLDYTPPIQRFSTPKTALLDKPCRADWTPNGITTAALTSCQSPKTEWRLENPYPAGSLLIDQTLVLAGRHAL